ncbi:MAG: DUF2232 domain-containing protein [Gammaproteobacteria bacterium]
MRALGNFIFQGRLQAIGVTSFLTIISLLLPPLSYLLSGVPVSLVTLRRGPVYGMQVIIGSLLVMMLFALLANINPQIATAFAIGVWAPVWLCANVLRSTASHGALMLAAGALGAVYILVTHLLLGDVSGWWQNWIDTLVTQSLTVDQAEHYREAITAAAPFLNAMMAAGLVISMVLTALIARWWQSMLYHPGGFRKEFYALQLPRGLLLVVLLGIGLVFMGEAKPGSIVLDMMILLVFIYLFQGVASIHRFIAARGLPAIWLLMIYTLLFILPQMILFVACLGIVDSCYARAKLKDGNDNS